MKKRYLKMIEYGKLHADKAHTPASLTKVLRSFVGSADVKLKTNRSNKVGYDQVVVGGRYDPDADEENFASISIFVTFNPEQKVIFTADIDWKYLCADLLECVGHEIIHQEQYRSRNFDIRPEIFVSETFDRELREEQEYLGNLDEVEAYGFSIAAQIYLLHRSKHITSNHLMGSMMFQTYLEVFGSQHPIVKKLLVHTHNYYAQMKGESNAKRSRQHV